MSRKSRPPEADKKGKKKGRGTKADVASVRTVVIEEPTVGPPFGLVVLIALVLSIPSILQFVDGTMQFDGAALRFLAALAVSWLLVHLVYAVAHAFKQDNEASTETTTATFEGDPNAQYRTTIPGDTTGFGEGDEAGPAR